MYLSNDTCPCSVNSCRKPAIKTILTANDAQLKAAFGDAGSQVAKLGKKLQDEAEKSSSKWGQFKTGFKEAFSFGAVASMGAMVGEKLVAGVEEVVKALPEFAEKAKGIGLASQKLGMSGMRLTQMAARHQAVSTKGLRRPNRVQMRSDMNEI